MNHLAKMYLKWMYMLWYMYKAAGSDKSAPDIKYSSSLKYKNFNICNNIYITIFFK